jgi:hypothetical protein
MSLRFSYRAKEGNGPYDCYRIQTIPAKENSDQASNLDAETTYYWRVDITGTDGGVEFARQGQVWSYTTESCAIEVKDGDLNNDCLINEENLKILAENWLYSG